MPAPRPPQPWSDRCAAGEVATVITLEATAIAVLLNRVDASECEFFEDDYGQGNREQYCAQSPIFATAIIGPATVLASRLRFHPSVVTADAKQRKLKQLSYVGIEAV